MAATQYIGARYVPKIYENSSQTPDWTANTIYEPLTIVTRNGNSYISKKTVPANIGAPESNPAYWAAMSVFNAQVAALSDTLDFRTTQKYILIGSSISLSVGAQLVGGCQDMALKNLGIDPDDYYNSAVSGSGWCAGGTKFIDQLTTAVSTVSDEFKAANVRIIVSGGMNNDLSYGATYLDAVDAFVAYAKANFPRCTIEFVPFSWRRSHSGRKALYEFYHDYTQYLPDHGVILWDHAFAYMHNYKDWFRDEQHYTQAGTDIATRMFEKILTHESGGDWNPWEGLLAPIAPDNLNANIDSINWGSVREYFDGDSIMLTGGGTLAIGSGGLTLSTSQSAPTEICDNPFHYIGACPFTNGIYYGDISCSIKNSNNDVVDCHAYVNSSGRFCIYGRKAISFAASSSAGLKFWSIPKPKELS